MYQSYKSSLAGLKNILKEFEPNIKTAYGKSIEDFREADLFNDRAVLISWQGQTVRDYENAQYGVVDSFNLYAVLNEQDGDKDLLQQIEKLKEVLNTKIRVEKNLRTISIESINPISDDYKIIIEIGLTI